MVDDSLLDFISKSRQRGKPDDQIVQQLLSVGWRNDKVEAAFAQLQQGSAPSQSPPPSPPPAQPPSQYQPQQFSQPMQQAQPLPQQQFSPQQPQQPSPSSLPTIPPLTPSQQPQQQPQPVGQPIDIAQKKPLFSLPNPFAKKQDQPPADNVAVASPMPQGLQGGGQQPERQHTPIELAQQPKPGGFTSNKLVMYAITIILGVVLAIAIYYFLLMPMMLPASAREEARPAVPKPPAGKTSYANNSSGGMQAAPPGDAQAEFVRLAALSQQVAYKGEYDASFGSLQSSMAIYSGGPAKKRVDTSLGMGSRSYTLGNETYGCTKSGESWSCTQSIVSAEVSIEGGDALENPSKYSIDYEGTAYIANSSASCFKATSENGSYGRYCLSTEGVPLLIEVFQPALSSAPLLSMEAKSHSLLEDDSAFELPAQPTQPGQQAPVVEVPIEPPTPEQPETPEQPSQSTAPTMPVEFVQPSQNNSTEKNFTRTSRHASSQSYGLDAFCAERGGEFYRAHSREFWGGDCSSERPGKEAFAYGSNMTSICADVPCCVSRNEKEFSTLYDYFECGFNE